MQTFREVLGRQEERQNLKNMGLCLLLILGLILVSFGVSQVRPFPHKALPEYRGDPISREPHAYP